MCSLFMGLQHILTYTGAARSGNYDHELDIRGSTLSKYLACRNHDSVDPFQCVVLPTMTG
jgi:hypothetical protein